METIFVFPNSLFEKNELLNKNTNVYIIEHPVYFTLYKYHKLKLILHRATMKRYFDFIKKKYKCNVNYVEYKTTLESTFKKIKTTKITFHDPVDHLVIKQLKSLAKKYKKQLVAKDTPLFMSNLKDLEEYKNKIYNKKYSHDSFYKWQRKRFDILMQKNGNPKGNKWSFDVKNRKPFSKDMTKNKNKIYIPKKTNNKYIRKAVEYITKHFNNNPGSTDFYLPIDYDGAKKHFKKFMMERFDCFGPYQDAVSKNIPFGCHSIISPLLNCGLLTPEYVVINLEKYGLKNNVPMASLEGIIRQIIGWREYVRMMYMFERKSFEKKNHLDHNKNLKKFWFNGIDKSKDFTTGFDLIDDMINKTMKNGYLHHIERLMYVGNFMILNQIKPKDTFDWFSSLFMDAYNWVMYPNVYGMSQYSAGPIMMTRPYFSSSAYISRMSDYKKGKSFKTIKLSGKNYKWNEVWDAIYYNFIAKHKKEFEKNYAIAMQVRHWDNKSKKEQKELKKIASAYFKKY
jgi:deoxyribodipyrimidine photolyase-related protein